MKKFLLLILICSFYQFNSFGQICNQGLSPNQGSRGQTLTTTITNNLLFNGYGSAPCNPSDVYLQHISSPTIIYASGLSIQNDSVRLTWNLPSNAPIGAYNMNLSEYVYDPINGNCLIGPMNCFRPQAFGIGVSIVSGSVFFDSNQDSVYNTGDLYLGGRKVMLMPDSVFTFTNNLGQYNFFTDTGNHSIVILNDTSFNSVNNDTILVHVDSTNIDSLDFAIYPTSASYNTLVYISGRARCNTTQTYTFDYRCYSLFPVNVVIKIYHSQNAPFVNSVPPPDSISGDTLFYSILNALYGSGHINLNFQIPGIGDTVTFYTVANTFDSNWILVANDANKLEQIVRCSWDPNDKAVNPEGEQAQHYTLFDETLFYKIRFQNTGTDTAYDVHIIDTIDSNLDLSTMQLISYSHPVIVELGFDGIVNFKFNNIMLPDSFVNEPASNGFVSYTIKPKTLLPEMTVITNKAYIYFDQNPPVETNVTDNTMVSIIPVGISSPENREAITFYPNPFNATVVISGNNILQFDHTLIISDIQGREVYQKNISADNYVIDLHDLSSGVYIYKFYNKKTNQFSFGKLIKQ